MSDTRYWRCAKTWNKSVYIEGAVYRGVAHYSAKEMEEIADSTREQTFRDSFIPWIPKAGDWVKCIGNLRGDEDANGMFLLERIAPEIGKSAWKAIGREAGRIVDEVYILPVLHRAPHAPEAPADELRVGDEVEQIKEWEHCAEEATPNQVGLRRIISQIDNRHEIAQLALKKIPCDHWMSRKFFDEHFRKISGGTVNVAPIVGNYTLEAMAGAVEKLKDELCDTLQRLAIDATTPKPVIPAYIGASAAFARAQEQRRIATGNAEFVLDAHKRHDAETAKDLLARERKDAADRAALDAKRRVIRTVRTGIFDLAKGFEC